MFLLGRILLVLCMGLAGVVVFLEEKLIYFPAKYPHGFWNLDRMQAKDGLTLPTIEDCWFVAEDGVKLHGWLCSPHREKAPDMVHTPGEMVLLWFHGNAGNVTDRYDMIRALMRIPIRVLIVDYRGYGKSEGRPTEGGLYQDARAAWGYLTSERHIPPDRIVLLGKSLGGAVAIDLATQVNPAGLIVQSSFTSVLEMARTLIPFLPGFLLRTKMDSINKIPRVTCPKLFIHSPADEIVPYRLGRRLLAAAADPKQFHEVPGAPHNETYIAGGDGYIDALRSFIHSCAPRTQETSS
jgi:hypothetical protein